MKHLHALADSALACSRANYLTKRGPGGGGEFKKMLLKHMKLVDLIKLFGKLGPACWGLALSYGLALVIALFVIAANYL